METELPRNFPDEPSRRRWLETHFAEFRTAEEPPLTDAELPDARQQAAEARLAAIEPERYAAGRNFLAGPVTRLSFDIRHGLLSLPRVARAALKTHGPERITKFLQELAWRDFHQRLLHQRGAGLWSSQEAFKTGLTDADYRADLPDDIRTGRTGLACIDAFQRQLVGSGYLHNHARLYFAAYVIHWRRVHWRAGAQFFLRHLIDADLASNNASWQWVASCFASKPYIFNRDNLDHYSQGRFCRTCPSRNRCPFDGSYEELAAQLFPEAAEQ